MPLTEGPMFINATASKQVVLAKTVPLVKYEVTSPLGLVARAESDLQSKIVGNLSPGRTVELLEQLSMPNGSTRMCVLFNGERAWVTSQTKSGRENLRVFGSTVGTVVFQGSAPPVPPPPECPAAPAESLASRIALRRSVRRADSFSRRQQAAAASRTASQPSSRRPSREISPRVSASQPSSRASSRPTSRATSPRLAASQPPSRGSSPPPAAKSPAAEAAAATAAATAAAPVAAPAAAAPATSSPRSSRLPLSARLTAPPPSPSRPSLQLLRDAANRPQPAAKLEAKPHATTLKSPRTPKSPHTASSARGTGKASGRTASRAPRGADADSASRLSAENLRSIAVRQHEEAARLEASVGRHVSDVGSRLAEALQAKGVDAVALAREWGARASDGAIRKVDFRLQVKSLLGAPNPEAKEVDALWARIDRARSGTLGPSEVGSALKDLQAKAAQAAERTSQIRARAAQCRALAEQAGMCASAAEEAEECEKRLSALKGTLPVEQRLGALLVKRNAKVDELVGKWEDSGNGAAHGKGSLSRRDFKDAIQRLQLQATSAEIDELFTALAAGASTLGPDELKAKLRTLQEAAASADTEALGTAKRISELRKALGSQYSLLVKALAADEAQRQHKSSA